MYGKKQRIISFLMAFLLIFTFAFINPLTVSRSYAVLPAVTLTANGVKIIMGVLASAGIGITAGQALQEVDFEKASTAVASVIYRTLNGAEKIALLALSIVDNIVEVPISLYNSIINNGKKVLQTQEYSQTLLEQGITIKYANLTSDNSQDIDLHLPIYQLTNVLSDSWVTNREIDMREAEPFLVYDGRVSDNTEFVVSERITTNYFDFSTEENPVIEFATTSPTLFLTPSLRGYNIKATTNALYYVNCFYLQQTGNSIILYDGTANDNSLTWNNSMCDINKTAWFNSVPFSSLVLYYYFVRNSAGFTGVHVDVYNGDEFIGQRQYILQSDSGINSVVKTDNLFDTPSGLDTSVNVETNPTPVVQNSTATDNVITLPTTVEGSIGLTSTDVNIGTTTDTPGTDTGFGENAGTNTETMENINTNVGELVTGGTLGEQVNTNIGTVEGLHGEITEQVDFGAVFDTIAQYISSLDISSVTWFPVAVAGFITPFLPLISLGIILFFIDRVLNGGA